MEIKEIILAAFVSITFCELFFKPLTPLYHLRSTRKAILRVLIEQLHNVMSHFGADEINLYIKVKHNIKDPLEVR